MKDIKTGNLTFGFQAQCKATKYDDWKFYQKRFQSIKDGTKAVDIVCVGSDETWLIEVKDYRTRGPQKKSKRDSLAEVVAGKVRDTLSGLAAASANAEDGDEKEIAERALGKKRWRVVLHLEQPAVKLWPDGPISIANIFKKLSRKLKAVDEKMVVSSLGSPTKEAPWTVRQLKEGSRLSL